jgi:hypothetical protein
MKQLESPNAQGPNDLQEGIQPKVVYPEKQTFEFEGMDININQPQKPPEQITPMPTPAPRQVVPNAWPDIVKNVVDAVVSSASANDEQSIFNSIINNNFGSKDPKGVEVRFKIREGDAIGDLETIKTPLGFYTSFGESGIEKDVGKEYKLMIQEDGQVLFRRGNKGTWKPIEDDPVLFKAFNKRMDFISSLIDAPSSLASMASAFIPGTLGFKAAKEIGSIAGALTRAGASGVGAGLTQASPIGEYFAKTVEEPALVDYFLKFKGKTPPLASAMIEGVSQLAGEAVGGFFYKAAKTNRAIKEGTSQIAEAGARASDKGLVSDILTPGQRALGVPYASEIVDLELEVAKDPAVRSYLIQRNLEQAKILDDAVSILKSRAPKLPPGKSIKDVTYTPGGRQKESFIEREVKGALERIKKNENELYYSVPNLKNKQIINPTPILAAFEDAIIEQLGEEVLTNGVIDSAKVAKSLIKHPTLATEGEKDLLQIYIQLKNYSTRGSGRYGLSEPIEFETTRIFPERPKDGEYISAIQDALTAPPTQDSFLIPGMQGGLPPRGASDLGRTIEMQRIPGSPGFESIGEQMFSGEFSQQSLPGYTRNIKMPNELRSFSKFKQSLGNMAKQFDDIEIGMMYAEEKAKYVRARAFIPQGPPGTEREAYITLPQLTDIITKTQRVGEFNSPISEKTSAQKIAAELSGILNRMRADITMDIASKEGRPDLAYNVLQARKDYTLNYADLRKIDKAFDTDLLSKSFLNLPTEDAKLLLHAMPEANKLELQAEVIEDLFKKSHFNKAMYTIGKDGEFIGFDRSQFFNKVITDTKNKANMISLFGEKAYNEIVTLGKIAEKIDAYGSALEHKTKDLMRQEISRRGYRLASVISEGQANPSKVMRVINAIFDIVMPRDNADLIAIKDKAILDIARRLYQKEMSGGARVTTEAITSEMSKQAQKSAAKESIMKKAGDAAVIGIPAAIRGYRVIKDK